MLEGSAVFAGVKEFTAKSGKECRICKLVNDKTGEVAEIFMSDGCVIAKTITIMSKVKVKVAWASFGQRTSFSVVEILPA